MSLVTISDTHLTNHFDQRKYDKLKSVIESADKVVLNGDFWDGYEVDFDSFYKSKWRDLFLLLKSKNTVYLFGNHDKKEFSDDRIFEFCDIAEQKQIVEYAGKKLIFEHGDKHVMKLDGKLGINRPDQWQSNITEFLQATFIKIFGLRGFSMLFGRMNGKLKEIVMSQNPDANMIFFFGHVHVAEIDLESHFVNSGIFNYGFAQHVIVTDSGEIMAVDEKY